jgi:hypothetical protein
MFVRLRWHLCSWKDMASNMTERANFDCKYVLMLVVSLESTLLDVKLSFFPRFLPEGALRLVNTS